MTHYTIAIPARMASTRLPGKMLKSLGGKPVIQHVIERVKQVRTCNEICVVTDSQDIVNLAENLDVKGFITSHECRSGTERIVSVLDKMYGDWIFNVQGDEPFVEPALLEALIEKTKSIDADILTPVYPLKSIEDINNPNIVKVVLNNEKEALYFSRSPIPYARDVAPENWLNKSNYWGHLGIYGYRREILENYHSLDRSYLETTESLEQLKFLSNGYTIATYEASGRSVAIDTQEDLIKAEAVLKRGYER